MHQEPAEIKCVMARRHRDWAWTHSPNSYVSILDEWLSGIGDGRLDDVDAVTY